MEKAGSRKAPPTNRVSRNNHPNGRFRTTISAILKILLSIVALVFIVVWHRAGLSSDLRLFNFNFWSHTAYNTSKPPNIVFILTDDQDLRLGSLNYMKTVQSRIIGEGLSLAHHFGTVALCCPARATLLRGQAAHNTNITHVGGPGGGYPKWLRTGEWKDYLPYWLHEAGYTTAYFGKFMNGYGLKNYQTAPAEWHWTDVLVQPYIYSFNNVVMSENGERPIHYEGWHQIDVLRIKALHRLEMMARQPKPFYIEIAPASPHVVPGGYPTIPPARHIDSYPGLAAPRPPNYNPSDEHAQQKPGWIRDLPAMNESVAAIVDASMRARVQALQGVDELVEDVIDLLERRGVLDQTYIIYTTDNGFHLGNHRVPGGKGLPYLEDVNLPFAIRGPGIPPNQTSPIPSTHIDIAPTLLDIAGIASSDWPPFFDGRTLLKAWQTLDTPDDKISREVLNVEFWGSSVVPAGDWTRHMPHNSYKSLRIVTETQGYLFNRWCFANQTELYDTTVDPYELTNLAIEPTDEVRRLMDRLAGLLLVTKSCGQESCRKPWEVLRSAYGRNSSFASLEEAMYPVYDAFFASLPHFGFQSCMSFQSVDNERPYYPPESAELGGRWRELAVDDVFWENNFTVIEEPWIYYGDERQRYMGWEELMRTARPLTDEEIGWTNVRCDEPDYCGAEYEDD